MQDLFFGFHKQDILQIAEMIVILLLSIIAIIVIRTVLYRLVFRAFALAFRNPPDPQFTYRTLFWRMSFASLIITLFYFLIHWLGSEIKADPFIIGGISAVLGSFVHMFYHRQIIPWWAALPPTFTIKFTVSAPGYQPLRKLSIRHRGEIAGAITVSLVVMILFARLLGWIDPYQPVFYGISVTDYLSELKIAISDLDPHDESSGKAYLFSLVEVMVVAVLYLCVAVFLVLPIANNLMRIIPSFNIKLTILDHLGLIAACCLGIYVGYVIPLF